MDNISPFPDRTAIEQEAADWLARLDSDIPPSQKELDSLREWLSRSPVHREELNNLNAFWGSDVLTELIVPLGNYESVSRPGRLKHVFHINRRPVFIGIATMATFLLTIALYFGTTNNPIEKSNGFYLTAVGQQQETTLADGTVIYLNTNSQVEVAYSDTYRNIRLLQGEAHFDVAKLPEQPFRVYAGMGRVQAIGTAFTVRVQDQTLSVLVTEGKIKLASLAQPKQLGNTTKMTGNDPKTPGDLTSAQYDTYVGEHPRELGILKAGQRFILEVADADGTMLQDLSDTIETVDEEGLARHEAWRDGLLVFSGESLEQVVSEISRYTTMSIEIVDPAVRNVQIGGRFRVGNIENMFSALETNFGIHVNRLSYNRVQLSAAH